MEDFDDRNLEYSKNFVTDYNRASSRAQSAVASLVYKLNILGLNYSTLLIPQESKYYELKNIEGSRWLIKWREGKEEIIITFQKKNEKEFYLEELKVNKKY